MKKISEFFKKLKSEKSFYVVLLIICIIVLVVSVIMIIKAFLPPENDLPEKYKNDTSKITEEELPDNPINFEKLQSDNNEVVGWITVPSTEGTIIDYPVLQSSYETEEDFYINHDINKESKREGSIYIQRDNASDFSDFNTVIYGHNMMNKSMFGTLKKYRNAEYFNNNRTITVYCPGHIKEYEIVSAFIYDDRLIISSFNYFMNDEQKQSFIDTCKNPNTLVKNVVENFDVTTNDELITLSTCTSADTERYLVVAKLVKDTRTK